MGKTGVVCECVWMRCQGVHRAAHGRDGLGWDGMADRRGPRDSPLPGFNNQAGPQLERSWSTAGDGHGERRIKLGPADGASRASVKSSIESRIRTRCRGSGMSVTKMAKCQNWLVSLPRRRKASAGTGELTTYREEVPMYSSLPAAEVQLLISRGTPYSRQGLLVQRSQSSSLTVGAVSATRGDSSQADSSRACTTHRPRRATASSRPTYHRPTTSPPLAYPVCGGGSESALRVCGVGVGDGGLQGGWRDANSMRDRSTDSPRLCGRAITASQRAQHQLR